MNMHEFLEQVFSSSEDWVLRERQAGNAGRWNYRGRPGVINRVLINKIKFLRQAGYQVDDRQDHVVASRGRDRIIYHLDLWPKE